MLSITITPYSANLLIYSTSSPKALFFSLFWLNSPLRNLILCSSSKQDFLLEADVFGVHWSPLCLLDITSLPSYIISGPLKYLSPFFVPSHCSQSTSFIGDSRIQWQISPTKSSPVILRNQCPVNQTQYPIGLNVLFPRTSALSSFSGQLGRVRIEKQYAQFLLLYCQELVTWLRNI